MNLTRQALDTTVHSIRRVTLAAGVLLLGAALGGCGGSGSSGGGGQAPGVPAGAGSAGGPGNAGGSGPTAPNPASPAAPSSSSQSVNDLASLSDDFSDPARLSAWRRVFQVEGWGFDQLETQDVGQTRGGWLTLVPYTSSWYEDYRGVLMFKSISGDFVVTTDLEASERAGTGAPSRSYSLAGIMVRSPRAITPATWARGGENYVFLSLGAANNPGTFQTEVKTTIQSVSTIEIESAPSGRTSLRFARIGAAVICLIRPEGTAWRVHRRFRRSDFPQELQVGLTVYTDWDTIFPAMSYEQHNTTQITGGMPDLRAQFDHVSYARPQVPAALSGRDLTDPNQVSDAELLGFLGS